MNPHELNFSILDEDNQLKNIWPDVSLTSFSDSFTNSSATILGGMSMSNINSVPVYSFSIEKLFNYDEKLMNYFSGNHEMFLYYGESNPSDDTRIVLAKSLGAMNEYNISMNAGEFPVISASFVCIRNDFSRLTITPTDTPYKVHIPKMDRILPYVLPEIFSDLGRPYSINFSESKDVQLRQRINDLSPFIILDSGVVRQKLSLTFLFDGTLDFLNKAQENIIDFYLKEGNETLDIYIMSEDGNDYRSLIMSNHKLSNITINASDSDVLTATFEFDGVRTIIK